MIKRSNTPLASRGLVLGCVAELDNIVKDKIHTLLMKIGSEQADKLMNDCTKLYYNSYSSNSDKIKDFLEQIFIRENCNGVKLKKNILNTRFQIWSRMWQLRILIRIFVYCLKCMKYLTEKMIHIIL